MTFRSQPKHIYGNTTDGITTSTNKKLLSPCPHHGVTSSGTYHRDRVGQPFVGTSSPDRICSHQALLKFRLEDRRKGITVGRETAEFIKSRVRLLHIYRPFRHKNGRLEMDYVRATELSASTMMMHKTIGHLFPHEAVEVRQNRYCPEETEVRENGIKLDALGAEMPWSCHHADSTISISFGVG